MERNRNVSTIYCVRPIIKRHIATTTTQANGAKMPLSEINLNSFSIQSTKITYAANFIVKPSPVPYCINKWCILTPKPLTISVGSITRVGVTLICKPPNGIISSINGLNRFNIEQLKP